ncbi:MAG: MBL fold metallo-hydrolase [Nitrososphaerota archaeon]
MVKIRFGEGEGWSWQLLLPGVPAVSNRGYLGWCSVSLLSFHEKGRLHYGLFDTGNVGDRAELLSSLKRRKIDPSEIEFVILSHLHYDHILNSEMFKEAEVYVLHSEVEYLESGARGDLYYPKSYIREIKRKLTTVSAKDKLYEGSFIELPGHTKGSMGFLIGRTLFAGDALKYSSEAKMRRIINAWYSLKLANKSLQTMLSLADIIIPGHDSPIAISNGSVKYQHRKEVGITLRGYGNKLTIKEPESQQQP